MERQGDLFDPEYLTYRSMRPRRTDTSFRACNRLSMNSTDKANPSAVAKGFHFLANQFRAEAERQLTDNR